MRRTMRQMAVLGLTAAAIFAFALSNARADTFTWTSTSSSDWTVSGNWGTGGIGPTGGTSTSRLEVRGGNTLHYTATQGTTAYNGDSRGLLLYDGTSMEIQGGTFSTAGSDQDIVGVNGTTAKRINKTGYHTDGRRDMD